MDNGAQQEPCVGAFGRVAFLHGALECGSVHPVLSCAGCQFSTCVRVCAGASVRPGRCLVFHTKFLVKGAPCWWSNVLSSKLHAWVLRGRRHRRTRIGRKRCH
jgi:hypothetical protein